MQSTAVRARDLRGRGRQPERRRPRRRTPGTGHRAPIQVISPWAAHGETISTYYSQISMVRTIEQVLGAEPLNQKVAAATPMFDAFGSKPDFTPYTAKPNRIPLTENIATPPSCGLDAPSGPHAARAATPTPARYVSYAVAWQKWASRQHLGGTHARPDFANPEQMNRYTWYDAHHWELPYPGDPEDLPPEPGAGRGAAGRGDGLILAS